MADSQWQWTDAQQAAFDTLKRQLATAPVLSHPDFALPFILTTDASDVGMGAVLSQVQGSEGNRKEHVIAYASRLLKAPETRYPAHEKEGAAIIWSLNKFHEYLDGNKFTIRTDNSAMSYLLSPVPSTRATNKHAEGRIARWRMKLLPYRYNIEHLHGKSNVIADALSRNFASIAAVHNEDSAPAADSDTTEGSPVEELLMSPYERVVPPDMRQEQLKDEQLAQLLRYLEDKQGDQIVRKQAKRYICSGGVLYRMKHDPTRSLLAIPPLAPESVLEGNVSGYPPLRGLLSRLSTDQDVSREAERQDATHLGVASQ